MPTSIASSSNASRRSATRWPQEAHPGWPSSRRLELHAVPGTGQRAGGLTPFLLDMVRPGMAIFGVYPETGFRTSGVIDLEARRRAPRTRRVREALLKGESAGYNRAYVAPRDVWIATLPVGHADGVPRAAAKGAKVRIGGRALSDRRVGVGQPRYCRAGPGRCRRRRPVRCGDDRHDLRLAARVQARGYLRRLRRVGIRSADAPQSVVAATSLS